MLTALLELVGASLALAATLHGGRHSGRGAHRRRRRRRQPFRSRRS